MSMYKGDAVLSIGIVKGVYYNIRILDGLPQQQPSGTVVETSQRCIFLGRRKPDGFSQQLRIIVTGVYYEANEMVLPSSGTVTRQQVIVKSVQSRQRGGPQCPVVAQQAQGGTVGGVDQQQATLTPRHNATNHATKTKAQCHQQETLALVAKSQNYQYQYQQHQLGHQSAILHETTFSPEYKATKS